MNTAVKVKHPQFIIAVDNSYFDTHNRDNSVNLPSDFIQGLTSFAVETFLAEVQNHIVIRQRAQLETEPQYRQLIPYTTLTQVGTDGIKRYVPYQRTTTAGEARLHGKVSIGFGGHVDLGDVVYGNYSVVDLGQTLHDAAIRERDEEITVYAPADLSADPTEGSDITDECIAAFSDEFILLDLTPVDAVHVGIVMEIQIPTGASIVANEDEMILLQAMSAADLLAQNPDGSGPLYDLENWTRTILEAAVRTDAAQAAAGETSDAPDDAIESNDATSTVTAAVALASTDPVVNTVDTSADTSTTAAVATTDTSVTTDTSTIAADATDSSVASTEVASDSTDTAAADTSATDTSADTTAAASTDDTTSTVSADPSATVAVDQTVASGDTSVDTVTTAAVTADPVVTDTATVAASDSTAVADSSTTAVASSDTAASVATASTDASATTAAVDPTVAATDSTVVVDPSTVASVNATVATGQ